MRLEMLEEIARSQPTTPIRQHRVHLLLVEAEAVAAREDCLHKLVAVAVEEQMAQVRPAQTQPPFREVFPQWLTLMQQLAVKAVAAATAETTVEGAANGAAVEAEIAAKKPTLDFPEPVAFTAVAEVDAE